MKLYHGTYHDFKKPKLNGLGILWLTFNPRIAFQYGAKSYSKKPVSYVWEIELKSSAKLPNFRDLKHPAIRAAFEAQNEANSMGLGAWTEDDWKQHADFGVIERWGWMVGLLKSKRLDGVVIQDSLGTIDIAHASVALFRLGAITTMERKEVDRTGEPRTIGDIAKDINDWEVKNRVAARYLRGKR
jgi:hypothetical protein